MKLLFLGGQESHNLHVKAAFDRRQVSDSDASSPDNLDLQGGLDFWALSTSFWANFLTGLEGWEKFCVSAVSDMRAVHDQPNWLLQQVQIMGLIFKCSAKCTEEFANCSIKQTNYDSIKNSSACTALIKFDFVPHRAVSGLCEE